MWNQKFYRRNRRNIARKSQKNRCDFLGRGIKVAAFPCFQNNSFFGTLRKQRWKGPQELQGKFRAFFSTKFGTNIRKMRGTLRSSRPARGLKNLPASKSQKKSLQGSLRGVPAGPPKKSQQPVKNESPKSKTGDFWLAESPGDSILTLFGASGRLFFWTF